MATKRIAPDVWHDSQMIQFADGKRTLESWELPHANDEDAMKITKKLLRELTYQEWLDQVAGAFGLVDYLNGRKLNSKRQMLRQTF